VHYICGQISVALMLRQGFGNGINRGLFGLECEFLLCLVDCRLALWYRLARSLPHFCIFSYADQFCSLFNCIFLLIFRLSLRERMVLASCSKLWARDLALLVSLATSGFLHLLPPSLLRLPKGLVLFLMLLNSAF
jgi:hypothetical protein